MGFQGAKRVVGEEEQGLMARLPSTIVQMVKGLVNETPYVVKKVVKGTGKAAKGTGKAAFMFGTSALILFLPLMIEMAREALYVEYDSQQGTILGV